MSRSALLTVSLCFLALLVATIALAPGKRAVTSPVPSTFNASPRGMKGLYLILQRSEIPTERLLLPWTDLSSRTGLLVVATPAAKAMSGAEVAALAHFLARGNRVLLLLREGEEQPPPRSLSGPLMTWLGIEPSRSNAHTPAHAPFPYIASERLAGLTLERARGFDRTGEGDPALISLVERREASLVQWLPVGAGGALIIATTEPVENQHLLEGTNLEAFSALVAGLGAGATVLFDEFHHGYEAPSAGALLRDAGFWSVVGQLLLAGALFVLATSRRTEPVRLPAPPVARSRREYVRAMANLYARGRHVAHATRVLLEARRIQRGRRAPRTEELAAERELELAVASGRAAERRVVALVRAMESQVRS